MIESYQEFVERLFVKRHEGIEGCMHAAIGISGEAGELLDMVKKSWVYGKPIDRENAIEELGDIEFYMQVMRTRLCVSREAVIEANRDKLELRYPSGYTDEAALRRADKV